MPLAHLHTNNSSGNVESGRGGRMFTMTAQFLIILMSRVCYIIASDIDQVGIDSGQYSNPMTFANWDIRPKHTLN